MNHHATPIPCSSEATTTLSTINAANEAQRFRSLALQLRRQSHTYREWARDMTAKGHRTAADEFAKSAQRYAGDAIWYWRRARQTAVQFSTQRIDA